MKNAKIERSIEQIKGRIASGEKLAEFIELLQNERYSENSILVYAKAAALLDRIIPGKTFGELTSEDLEKYLAYAKTKSPKTTTMYVGSLRRLLKWADDNGCGPTPEVTAMLARRADRQFQPKKRSDAKLPAYFTPQELAMIQKVCPDGKWRALFACLYGTGARISELLVCNIGDVEFRSEQDGDKAKWRLRVSKTEARALPWIKEGTTELLEWMRSHPDPENQNAPLFVNDRRSPRAVEQGLPYERISYNAVEKMFRYHIRPAAEALLDRRLGKPGDKISLHVFRHSRATNLAQSLTPAQMAAFFGWSQSSKMMAVYVNGAGVMAEEGMRRHYNEPVQVRPEMAYNVVECPCGYLNTEGSSYCSKCGAPLTDEARETDVDKQQFSELRSDMEVMKEFMTIQFERQLLEHTPLETKEQEDAALAKASKLSIRETELRIKLLNKGAIPVPEIEGVTVEKMIKEKEVLG